MKIAANSKVAVLLIAALVAVSWLSLNCFEAWNSGHKPQGKTEIHHPGTSVGGTERLESSNERTGHERLAENTTNAAQDDLSDAKDLVRRQGDYGKFKRMLSEMSQGDRYLLMMDVIPLTSKLGTKFDITEKDSMIAQITGPESRLNFLKDKVVEVEALERYENLKNEGVLEQLDANRIGVVFKTLASSRPDEAFARVSDLVDIDKQRIAAIAIAKQCVSSNMMRASQLIGQMAPGIARDEASGELALWLSQTKATDEARQWFESIQDPKTKARVKDFLKE